MKDTEQEDVAKKLECDGDVCTLPSTASTQSNDKKKKKISGSSRSFIKNLHSQQDLSTLIRSNETVIVEFMTSWCGACASIEPLFETLALSAAEEQDGPYAAQVICDKNKETKKLAAAFSVGSYPVFVVFENGRETGRWNGADRGKLEKAFDRLSQGRGGKGRKKRDKGR